METIILPQGACETIKVYGEERVDAFKVKRVLLEKEPLMNRIINVIMPNGFTYKGQIYHKTKEYVYIYLY